MITRKITKINIIHNYCYFNKLKVKNVTHKVMVWLRSQYSQPHVPRLEYPQFTIHH